jgi:transcriptional regulator with XRE-family HTH domain
MFSGELLSKARRILGYSQEYLAVKMSCSQRVISKLENNEVKLTDLKIDSYLKVLNKDREWLMDFYFKINSQTDLKNEKDKKISDLELKIKQLESIIEGYASLK